MYIWKKETASPQCILLAWSLSVIGTLHGGGSIGECGRLSKSSWLLGVPQYSYTYLFYLYLLINTYSINTTTDNTDYIFADEYTAVVLFCQWFMV